jgi:hypothetical protein
MNETTAKVIPFTGVKQLGQGQVRLPQAQAAIAQISSNMHHLVNQNVSSTWIDGGVVKPTGISYGAYNSISYRSADGTVMHSCGKSIDKLRSQRKHVLNAIELRCDALGFVIYVSGVNQIDPVSKALKQVVRIASYQHESVNVSTDWAGNADDLYNKLHYKLISTYNKLARDYNLAGLRTADLTLVSSHADRIPSIALNVPG